MILSGKEIRRNLGSKIIIEPFNEENINPNSYNVSLAKDLLVYTEPVLDMKSPNATKELTIPESGLELQPNKLYLGRTAEYTETRDLVPMLEGRSSIGRLGMFIHVTAGFGDIGFCGYWTLEIIVVQPLRVYPGVGIGQIFFHTIEGDYEEYKSGKYQNNDGIQASMLYKDFEK